MNSVCRVLLAITCILGTSSGQEDLQFRVFDLEGPLRNVGDAPAFPWALQLRQSYRDLEGADFATADESESNFGGADILIRTLRDAVAPESWERDGRFMRLNETGTRLFVRQTKENLDRLEQVLSLHASSTTQSFHLEVLVIAGSAAELAGLGGNRHIVSTERFNKIRSGNSGMKVLAALDARARDGQRVLLRTGTMRHFLGSQTAQIAQTAALTEPRNARVFEGFELLTRPLLMPDGRVNLRVQCRIGSGLDLRLVRSRSGGVGPIQLPSMHTTLFSSTAALQSGEAVVLGAVGAADPNSRFILLRVRADPSSDSGLQTSRNMLRAYRLGYLVSSYLSLPRIELGYLASGLRLYDDSDQEDEVFNDGHRFVQVESVMDLIRQTVTPDFWNQNPYTLEPDGTRLWVAAEAAQHEGLRSLLKNLNDTRAQFSDVEAICLKVDRSVVESLRSEDGESWLRELLRSPKALRLHSMVGAVELGARIEFLDGQEHARIIEGDAEVAQGADILAPAVETGFQGLYLRLAPYRLTAQKLGLDFDCNFIGLPESFEPMDDKLTSVAELANAQVGWASSKGHREMVMGDYQLLAEMAVPAAPGSSLLIILRLR